MSPFLQYNNPIVNDNDSVYIVHAMKKKTQQPAIARMEAGQVGEVSFDFLIRVGLMMGVELKLVQRQRAA